MGLGIAAHSKIGDTRFSNTEQLKVYISNINNKQLNYENIQNLTDIDKKEEFIMLSLRKQEGIDLVEYNKLFNENLLEKNKMTLHFYKKTN